MSSLHGACWSNLRHYILLQNCSSLQAFSIDAYFVRWNSSHGCALTARQTFGCILTAKAGFIAVKMLQRLRLLDYKSASLAGCITTASSNMCNVWTALCMAVKPYALVGDASFVASLQAEVHSWSCVLRGSPTCDMLVYGLVQMTFTASDKPRGMYKSLACQLGIHKTPGVWALLELFFFPPPPACSCAAGSGASSPPRTDMAKSIRTAREFLSACLPTAVFCLLYRLKL